MLSVSGKSPMRNLLFGLYANSPQSRPTCPVRGSALGCVSRCRHLRSLGNAAQYFSVTARALHPVQNVVNHHLGNPGQVFDRHVAVRLAPPGSRGSGHPQHVHGVLKLKEPGRRPSMRITCGLGTVTLLGVCSDCPGFTFGRFGPRIAPTTVELALLGLAHLQSRSATLEPRCF